MHVLRAEEQKSKKGKKQDGVVFYKRCAPCCASPVLQWRTLACVRSCCRLAPNKRRAAVAQIVAKLRKFHRH